MFALLVGVLLYPAPAQKPAATFQIVGDFSMAWGTLEQPRTSFTADGKYSSPHWGSGDWRPMVADDDGLLTLEFQEGDSWYVLQVDRNGVGTGARLEFLDDGGRKYGPAVKVKLTRLVRVPKTE